MGLKVEVLEVTGVDLVLNVLLELAVETLLIVIGKTLHVLSDVSANDVLAEGFSIELLGLDVESREALLGVGDEDTAVGSALHGTEDTGTGGSAGNTNIKESLEGAAGAIVGLDGLSESELTIGLLNTGEVLIQTKLLEGTAGEEQTSGVGGGPVGQTLGNAIALELMGVGAGKDLVASDLGVDDLGNDVAVGEANDQAVLGRVVLVLGLGHQALTGIVIGLSLPTTPVLSLIAAMVKLVKMEIYLNFEAVSLPVVSAVFDKLSENL